MNMTWGPMSSPISNRERARDAAIALKSFMDGYGSSQMEVKVYEDVQMGVESWYVVMYLAGVIYKKGPFETLDEVYKETAQVLEGSNIKLKKQWGNK